MKVSVWSFASIATVELTTRKIRLFTKSVNQ